VQDHLALRPSIDSTFLPTNLNPNILGSLCWCRSLQSLALVGTYCRHVIDAGAVHQPTCAARYVDPDRPSEANSSGPETPVSWTRASWERPSDDLLSVEATVINHLVGLESLTHLEVLLDEPLAVR
jgi:hypothetical protein